MKDTYWLYALGFFAQSLFGARLIVQLFYSEKQGKVVSPTIFWQLSLIGSFLFLVYGIIQDDFVIILGQTLSYFIYIRNLQLKNQWVRIYQPVRIILLILPFGAMGLTAFESNDKISQLFIKNDFTDPIIILGGIGQLMLNLRFVYQWYYSEKHKTSILPVGFWIISTIAAIFIIRYSLYTTEHKSVDPVLLSSALGVVIYIWNIVIFFRTKRKADSSVTNANP